MRAAVNEEGAAQARRGVSLGLVGLLFMLMTPVGLLVAWWHPLFRVGKKRDPLLVLAIVVYLASILWVLVLPSFIE